MYVPIMVANPPRVGTGNVVCVCGGGGGGRGVKDSKTNPEVWCETCGAGLQMARHIRQSGSDAEKQYLDLVLNKGEH